MKNKKIAIIGGGPVGLVTARLLQMRGIDVTVYERDKNERVRISGGTLDIHSDLGQKALKEAGILNSYFENSRAVIESRFDKNAKLLEVERPTAANKYDRPEIDRSDLRKIVLDVLSPATVCWDKQFVSMEKKEGGYDILFKDGSTVWADLIIAADGGRSKIRSFISDVMRVYTGTTIIQGEIQVPSLCHSDLIDMIAAGNLMALGEQKMIFIQTRRDQTLNYYVSFSTEENWLTNSGLDLGNNKQFVVYLENMFKSWNPVYHQLFQSTTSFQVLPMYRLPLDKPWRSYENIALVGDAAHVMPPFAGVGVNIGLLDALNLVNNLTSDRYETIEEAIQDYAQEMFRYASEAQAGTTQAEQGIHHVDAVNLTKDKSGRR